MARIDNLKNFLTDVANAIRTATSQTMPISHADFDTEIARLEVSSGSAPSGTGTQLANNIGASGTKFGPVGTPNVQNTDNGGLRRGWYRVELGGGAGGTSSSTGGEGASLNLKFFIPKNGVIAYLGSGESGKDRSGTTGGAGGQSGNSAWRSELSDYMPEAALIPTKGASKWTVSFAGHPVANGGFGGNSAGTDAGGSGGGNFGAIGGNGGKGGEGNSSAGGGAGGGGGGWGIGSDSGQRYSSTAGTGSGGGVCGGGGGAPGGNGGGGGGGASFFFIPELNFLLLSSGGGGGGGNAATAGQSGAVASTAGLPGRPNIGGNSGGNSGTGYARLYWLGIDS